MENTRHELDSFLLKQKELGMKRRDIALILFNKGYSENQVGTVMGVHPKTAHAFKVDFSKKGKEKRAKTGKRVHLSGSSLNLKRVDGKKVNSVFLSLVEKVLAENGQKETII